MVFVVLFLREKMAQAYDFALDKIGMEIMSYQVCFFLSKHSLFLNLWQVQLNIGFTICNIFSHLDLGGLHQFFERRVSTLK